jgi:hypothetical protein
VFPVEQSNRERKLKVWEEMVAGVRKQNLEAWSVIEAEATIHSKKKKKKKKGRESSWVERFGVKNVCLISCDYSHTLKEATAIQE